MTLTARVTQMLTLELSKEETVFEWVPPDISKDLIYGPSRFERKGHISKSKV
jgi:hypothetical protein